jgi:cytoskeletal protein RodZ
MNPHSHHSFGAGLRRAREQSGLTLRQIAEPAKLSVRSLESLERDDINQLPGGIYRRAIVRAYAAAVGLDPEKTLRDFLALHPDDVPSMAQLFPPVQRPGRRALHTIAGLLGATIPILAGVFYFTVGTRDVEAARKL